MGRFFIAYLGDLRKRPLLVNLKYWGGSSLTGLTVSDAPVTTTEKILQAALSSTISMGGIFAANGDGMFVSFHFDFDEVDVVVVAGDVHVDVVVVFDVF